MFFYSMYKCGEQIAWERNHFIRARWGAGICHPVPLVAVLITALNDHYLKYAGILPASMTGKISDITGLFFFPPLIVSIYFGIFTIIDRPPKLEKQIHGLVCIIVAAGFALVNLSVRFNEIVASFWMHKVMDPTDLVALLALFASWRFLERKYETRLE